MRREATVFGWAIAISFLGSLPLGTLNLSVANYAFRHNWPGAIGFGSAAIFVEMALVRIALAAIRRLERLTHFFRFFNILTGAVLLFLAGNSLLAAWQMETFRASLPLAGLSPVPAGLLLSLTNPLHLPFWMGWTAVLKGKNILEDRPRSYNLFITAIGLGTAFAFFLYGFAGGRLIQLLGNRQVLLNWVVGIALLITGLIQLYKTFFKKWKPFFLGLTLLVFAGGKALGQCEQVGLHVLAASDADVSRLEQEYGRYKQIPAIYKKPVLLALSHFPELRATRIRFRIRHAASPLTTNRDWGYYFAHFGLGRRAFVVTISNRTRESISPILFGRLDFNAQVGVAGHELSHVSDFRHKNLLGWLRLGIGHLSARYVDRLEFGTDSLCLAHGLGYNLLAWSCFVRSALRIADWQGAGKAELPFHGRERYMNPSTIWARIDH